MKLSGLLPQGDELRNPRIQSFQIPWYRRARMDPGSRDAEVFMQLSAHAMQLASQECLEANGFMILEAAVLLGIGLIIAIPLMRLFLLVLRRKDLPWRSIWKWGTLLLAAAILVPAISGTSKVVSGVAARLSGSVSVLPVSEEDVAYDFCVIHLASDEVEPDSADAITIDGLPDLASSFPWSPGRTRSSWTGRA